MKENGVGDRKKSGQCSFCLLVQGGGDSLWKTISFYTEGSTGELEIKFITQKLLDVRPTLGLERKCMGWDFPEPGPN